LKRHTQSVCVAAKMRMVPSSRAHLRGGRVVGETPPAAGLESTRVRALPSTRTNVDVCYSYVSGSQGARPRGLASSYISDGESACTSSDSDSDSQTTSRQSQESAALTPDGCSWSHVPIAGPRSEDNMESLREGETRVDEGESCVSGTDDKKTFRGMFSNLRVGLLRPIRPPRPSMLLATTSQLNSTYASLDDLDILRTIGTRRAFCPLLSPDRIHSFSR
jgi:hypothetical protein